MNRAAVNTTTYLCQFCGTIFTNDLKHVLFDCSYTSNERNDFFCDVRAIFGQSVTNEISNGPSETKLQLLIGRKLQTVVDKKYTNTS